MQFDLLRAFPYPVLRPNVDDYTDGDIQTMVELQAVDGDHFEADVAFMISVPALVDLVSAGKAVYAVVFACRDTYFRECITSEVSSFSHKFDAGVFRGEVLIYPYLLCVSEVTEFSSPWVNQEFGPGPFSFQPSSLLAIDQPQSLYIDRETFRPISSCFEMVHQESIPEDTWRVKLEGDKVQIAVNAGLKQKLDLGRNSKRGKAILINSIYFAAVMQCVRALKDSNDFDEYKWARIFRQRLHDLHVNLNDNDESWIAQSLMREPAALLATYCFGEDEQ